MTGSRSADVPAVPSPGDGGGADASAGPVGPRAHDVTAASSAVGDAALRKLEARHRTMLDAAGDAILVFDFHTARAVEVNRAACALFGYSPEEFKTMTGRTLAGPAAIDVVDRTSATLVATGSAFEPRHPMQRKDGSRFIASVRVSTYVIDGVRHYLSVVRDETAQVEAEQALRAANASVERAHEQLLHSNRLAALGQLAAGIAHEISNPLQFMVGSIESLEELVEGHPEAPALLSAMRDGTSRIRTVVRALLPFARVETFEMERLDLQNVVLEAQRMVAHELRDRAVVEVQSDGPALVLGDRLRLMQVVTNLLTNAAHAIVDGPVAAHRIVVSTRNEPGLVALTVEDTGVGIGEADRARLFEPFYTTKARELGTGLGLTLCAEIVRRHGGTIDLVPREGGGTLACVQFPALDARSSSPPSQPATEPPRPT